MGTCFFPSIHLVLDWVVLFRIYNGPHGKNTLWINLSASDRWSYSRYYTSSMNVKLLFDIVFHSFLYFKTNKSLGHLLITRVDLTKKTSVVDCRSHVSGIESQIIRHALKFRAVFSLCSWYDWIISFFFDCHPLCCPFLTHQEKS